MKKSNLLQKGFTTRAEQIAEEYRNRLNIHPCDHLCAFQLATYLGVNVCKASDYGLTDKVMEMCTGWSGLYLVNKFGEKVILHNTSHPMARQQSTIMHELAHIICKHPLPTDIILPALPFLRRYNPQHEKEAEYLGATLQITRKGLVWAKCRGSSYK